MMQRREGVGSVSKGKVEGRMRAQKSRTRGISACVSVNVPEFDL